MTVISGGKSSVGKRLSPNGNLVLFWLPKNYPKTPQQRKAGEVARSCGIHKGMDRAALRKAMIECVGPKMRRGG